VSRTTKEVVDTINVRSDREAFKYFQQRKQLDKDAFDRLFEVVRKEENNDGNRLTRF
jgi:hypothetical protein|tara:strand:+ start:92 stop:262 length:171 start_codon:yes stop_codon:yes gene_type:complete